MAKKMKKILALMLVLVLMTAQMMIPVSADPWGWNPWYPGGSSQYEWYNVVVQGQTVASGQGGAGDVYYLGTHYEADVSVSGNIVSWSIVPYGGSSGSFGGSVNLEDVISVPEGFEILNYTVDKTSIDGVNDPVYDMYDNCVITVTVKTFYNPITQETIPVEPDPTEPDPTDPEPVETSVTVNHKYSTYDIYTGETVVDGTTSSSAAATEGDSYSATPVPSYNGNEYIQQTDDAALTITVQADAAANVINTEYLRSIDTTPQPAQTSVTVNHIYKTYDIYTGETVVDGTTGSSHPAVEGDSYTAAAIPTYNGNLYAQQTADAALTITVKADAAANVVNIEYLRTIDTTPIDYEPVLQIIKTADKAVFEIGENISWTIKVKNISQDTAYNVVITDELTGDNWNVAAIAPGEEKVFTAVSAAAEAGSLENVAVVSWDDGDELDDPEEPKTAQDDETVTVNEPEPEPTEPEPTEPEPTEPEPTEPEPTEPEPTEPEPTEPEPTEPPAPVDLDPVISVKKTADKESYIAGQTIIWTITVKNESSHVAHNVVIEDELTGDHWTLEFLAPGAEVAYTATSIAAAGQIENIAVVTWEDNDGIDEPEEPNVAQGEMIVTAVEPEPEPTPAPESTPTPAPAPESTPAPAPAPTPTPESEPASAPEPAVASDDGIAVAAFDGEIEIPDEEVPLADAPETGDSAILWAAMSLLSAGGFIGLNKKRKK